MAGHDILGSSNTQLNTICFIDVDTHHDIDKAHLLANLAPPGSQCNPESIPKPAAGSGLKGFVTVDQNKTLQFHLYSYGTLYFFQTAANKQYHFVSTWMWQDLNELDDTAHQHLDMFVDWAMKDVTTTYRDHKNSAQNAEAEKNGELYMTGWHMSMQAESSITHYTPHRMHASYLERYREVTKDTRKVA
ncbi:hypothetical protein FRC06_003311, partial [Ceratobasidium sp. 370]